MRVSTKRRLAVNAMIDLALREEAAPVALVAMAKRQQVSPSCLEQLFVLLRKAGLVERTRGPGGGYSLAREAAAISVAAIIAAVENGARAADEEERRPGLTSDLSRRLQAVMQAHMAGIALADLIAGQRDEGSLVEARLHRSAPVPRLQVRHLTASVPNSVFELGAVLATGGAWRFGR